MAQKSEKIGTSKILRALAFWHGVATASLKQLPVDLSSRQMAILLHIYLVETPHSIKNMTKELKISKPAICRAINVLEGAKLVRRVTAKDDKRNVAIVRTAKGVSYLNGFAEIIINSSKEAA